jgi:hypothetical protein
MDTAAEGPYAQHEAPPVLLQADDKLLEIGGSSNFRHHDDILNFSA